MLKKEVVMFTAHLSVTIKRLTRYTQKVVLAAMLEGMSILPTPRAEVSLLHGFYRSRSRSRGLTVKPRQRLRKH